MFRDDAQGRGGTGVTRTVGQDTGAGGAGGASEWEGSTPPRAKRGDRAEVQGSLAGAKGDLGGLEVELSYEDELELQLASY